MAGTRARGWWYPWIFVGAMAVVVVVNGILAWLAVDTWSGIETEDHYRKGLAYDDNLAAAKAQDRLGWSVDLALMPKAGGIGDARALELAVTFTGADGRPVDGLDVAVEFFRPTHEGFDVTARLGGRGGGTYAAPVTLPLAGQWQARVLARRGDDTFQNVRRIVVP